MLETNKNNKMTCKKQKNLTFQKLHPKIAELFVPEKLTEGSLGELYKGKLYKVYKIDVPYSRCEGFYADLPSRLTEYSDYNSYGGYHFSYLPDMEWGITPTAHMFVFAKESKSNLPIGFLSLSDDGLRFAVPMIYSEYYINHARRETAFSEKEAMKIAKILSGKYNFVYLKTVYTSKKQYEVRYVKDFNEIEKLGAEITAYIDYISILMHRQPERTFRKSRTSNAEYYVDYEWKLS